MTKRLTPATGPPLTPVAMGKSDPEAVRTLRCRTIAKGRLHQLNYIRNLPPQQVMEDEPGGLLGEAVAPNASEALLAALGSCLVVGIHADAVAQRIPIRSLELELEADIDTTAVWGAGDRNPKSMAVPSAPSRCMPMSEKAVAPTRTLVRRPAVHCRHWRSRPMTVPSTNAVANPTSVCA